MCNLYSITTNQSAIVALFRVVNRYVGWAFTSAWPFHFYPAGRLTMRQFLRVLIWPVAALFCTVTAVVWAYIATFVGSFVFQFSIESPTALTCLYGSMAIFAVMSCAFLTYLGIKMAKGDL